MTSYEIWQILILTVNIFAIIIGPIVAIQITRNLDGKNEAHRRKFAIFSELMKTRQTRIDYSHVAALNLVPLEFYGHDTILACHTSYLRHLYSAIPQEADRGRYLDEQQDLFLQMLQTIGKFLEYQFDKRELDRVGYAPIVWENDQQLLRRNADLTVHASGQFPPPP
jgi:hypothetical protein